MSEYIPSASLRKEKMKIIYLGIELATGQKLPPGYGLAYRDYLRDCAVFYPVPLNVLVRIAREIYFILARGVIKSRFERLVKEAEMKGYQQGYREGQVNAIEVVSRIYTQC